MPFMIMPEISCGGIVSGVFRRLRTATGALSLACRLGRRDPAAQQVGIFVIDIVEIIIYNKR